MNQIVVDTVKSVYCSWKGLKCTRPCCINHEDPYLSEKKRLVRFVLWHKMSDYWVWLNESFDQDFLQYMLIEPLHDSFAGYNSYLVAIVENISAIFENTENGVYEMDQFEPQRQLCRFVFSHVRNREMSFYRQKFHNRFIEWVRG